MNARVLLGGALAALLFAPVANAAETRVGTTVEVGPNETIEDDLYVAGRTVNIRGTVKGDVVGAAGTLTIDGTVEGDVLAAAGNAAIGGDVKGSVRALGGELVTSAKIGRDFAAAGGTVKLEPDASVGRDAMIAAGNAEIRAPVDGKIDVSGGTVSLAGRVGKDVRAQTDTLKIEDGAKIGGALSYRASHPAEIASGASIAGAVSPKIVARRTITPAMWIFGWFRMLVGMFALGLVLVLVWPRWSTRTALAIRETPWGSLGIGVAAAIGVPIAAALVLVLGAMLGGWWLGLALLALYLVAIAVAFPVIGLFVGRLILPHASDRGGNRVLMVLIGLALLLLAVRVPILGAIVALATIFLGLGASVLASLPSRRPPPLAP